MKTIIYCRVSTEEQEPQNQIDDCNSINKWGEHEVLLDKQSAWKDNVDRESFEKIKRLIRNKRVGHLIVWDLDRIYRNRKKLIIFFELCSINKCKVHSFRQEWLEKINDMPEPWNEIVHSLMLQVMGWLAEEESSKKSDRVKAAVRRVEGKATVSYKGNKWGRKSLSKKTVENIIKLKDDGLSLREIAKRIIIYDKHGNAKNISKSAVHKTIISNHT